ncbi:MAG: UDP-N-acetylglucosamine 2-epimerase (non-hydrolyzing) [Deltaproteobacteria bacterium]|jgi:UDP-N-acetylglucosamine 2-epimerase|nr:UDP-N-acetylglucosamine 2-epimerase (non-hydrolyzing) [Deltaproteobacteria bacterium]
MSHKIVIFVGTRPEAVKMAPVVLAFRSGACKCDVHLCSTGQHRQMLEQSLSDFNLVPDSTLEVMTQGQTLAGLSSRLFAAVDGLLEIENPDAVLVQGDTTTVQVASLCAFYRGIPVGHVEAGLRTNNIRSPFPEELNRRITTLAAAIHFAPTELARRNLIKESVEPSSILVTGNTVVDALLYTREAITRQVPVLPERLEEALAARRPLVLVTGHRRENFGGGLRSICEALSEIAQKRPDAAVVYPVHLNPQVKEPVHRLLGGMANVYLEEPLPYRSFVRLMAASTLILTDSGGIQEEAPTFGKPVLIMRDSTERPEGVLAGVNMLVGACRESIVDHTLRILEKGPAEKTAELPQNPYGDGKAAGRIVGGLLHMLQNSGFRAWHPARAREAFSNQPKQPVQLS